jgi:hypothetical protein
MTLVRAEGSPTGTTPLIIHPNIVLCAELVSNQLSNDDWQQRRTAADDTGR